MRSSLVLLFLVREATTEDGAFSEERKFMGVEMVRAKGELEVDAPLLARRGRVGVGREVRAVRGEDLLKGWWRSETEEERSRQCES